MYLNQIPITFQVNNGHSLTTLINAYYNGEEIKISDDYYIGLFNCMSLVINPTLAIIAPLLWLSVALVFVEEYCKKAYICDDSEKEMLWDNTDYSGYEAI